LQTPKCTAQHSPVGRFFSDDNAACKNAQPWKSFPILFLERISAFWHWQQNNQEPRSFGFFRGSAFSTALHNQVIGDPGPELRKMLIQQ